MLWLCYVMYLCRQTFVGGISQLSIFYMYIRPNEDDSDRFSIIVVVRQVVKCPIQKREKTEEGRRRRGRDPAAHSLSAMPVGGLWSGTLPASVLRIAILTNPYKTASYKCDGAQNGIATPPSSPSHSHNFTSFLGLHLRVL